MEKFKFFNSSKLMKGSLDITVHIQSLISEAAKSNCIAACIINDRTILAKADSDEKLLVRDLMRSQYGLIPQKVIGPYPEKEIPEKEQKAYETFYANNR